MQQSMTTTTTKDESALRTKICPTDDDSIQPIKKNTTVSQGQRQQQQLSKNSVEYALRSGLAGGLAGCAVCSFSLPYALYSWSISKHIVA